jgi:hypothetical protein
MLLQSRPSAPVPHSFVFKVVTQTSAFFQVRDVHYTLPPVVLTKLGPLPGHRHGVTVSSRIKSAQSSARSEKSDGELLLPKTFCTRKGALLLFTAPETVPELTNEDRDFIREKMRISNIQGLSQKIGTLHRLTKSVLMYGDEVSTENNILYSIQPQPWNRRRHLKTFSQKLRCGWDDSSSNLLSGSKYVVQFSKQHS